MSRRRVAVTGIGLVSCLGHDLAAVGRALREGRSGVRAMPEWDRPGLRSRVAGALPGAEERFAAAGFPKQAALAMCEAGRWCALAARDAVADAGLEAAQLGDRGTGCFVGSGVGDVRTVHRTTEMYHAGHLRRADPFAVLRAMSSSPSATVATLLGVRGRSYSLTSACATSAHNVGHAYELIRDGALDRAVAGGGEEVSDLVAAAFSTLRLALSTRYNDEPERASRPYDAGRDGFVVGGGAGIVVLEELAAARRRGARIHCEIAGFAANSDAHDPVLPDPTGAGAAACIEAALADAGVTPDAVGYVNTHGTSTRDGDVAELNALRRVFGPRVPLFSSTKSMTGHPLGAAGALELAFCASMLEEGYLAPSINVDDPDPAVAGLPLITTTRDSRVDVALSNSFCFGGTN
ncbi:MAG TPA: beta-ketoacyl-[acyl-carrier-protein] synthase family protein, partial [Thermoanaerobaculia bacterium]